MHFIYTVLYILNQNLKVEDWNQIIQHEHDIAMQHSETNVFTQIMKVQP